MPMLADRSTTNAIAGGPVSHSASAHCANITSTRPSAASLSTTRMARYVRLALPDSRAYRDIVQAIASSTRMSVAHGAQRHLESSCHIAVSAFDGTGTPIQSATQAGKRPLIMLLDRIAKP